MVGRLSVRRSPDSDETLSRRKIFKGIAGVAAVGAGGVVLADAAASPASAAPQGTTVESDALAPAVVNLADGATIGVDASLGNDFRVTIAGNRAIGTPANPTDGQKITLQVTQGTGGSFTLSWGSGYAFSPGLPQPALSTTAGLTDLLGFIYNAAKGKWLFVALVSGFTSPAGHPASGYLPAVPRNERAVRPGLLFRAVHLRRRGSGHQWRLLARWILVVGMPVRAVDGGTEVRALGLYNPNSGSLVAEHGHLRRPDGRAVELRAAGSANTAGHRRLVLAATGFTGSFPDTNSQFGSGEPHAAASSAVR